MTSDRNRTRTGAGEGARSDDGKFLGCLTETAIQGFAERMLADEHFMVCPRCSAELAVYQGLMQRLNALCDPPLPVDFTNGVLAAVQLREQVRDERHRAVLASLPAALIALGVLLAWAFAVNPAQRLRDLVVGATVCERVCEATFSVMQAVRVPLALGSLLFVAAVLAALWRALSQARTPATARA